MRTPSGHKVYAIAAEYSSASELYEAAKRVRDAGFKRWDVFSPFPIHGMDEAMGLGKSWLSAVVLAGGITGLLTAITVEFGPSWLLYPVIVHGKPFNWATVPAFFPENTAPARHGKFFPTWCASKKCGRNPRSIFSVMAAVRGFPLRVQSRSVTKCQNRRRTRLGLRRAALRLAKSCRAQGSVSASARIITTPARWARTGALAFLSQLLPN